MSLLQLGNSFHLDPDDDQRGEGITENEHFKPITTDDEYFGHWRMGAVITDAAKKRYPLATQVIYQVGGINGNVLLKYPKRLRGCLILEISVPREQKKSSNPAMHAEWTIHLKFAAHKLDADTFTSHRFNDPAAHLDQEFRDAVHLEGKEFMVLNFIAKDCTVTGGNIPPLSSPDLQTRLKDLIEAATLCHPDSPLNVQCVLRASGDTTMNDANLFKRAIDAEKVKDPLAPWFKATPNKEALNVGNLTAPLERPDIGVQRAETTFADEREYKVAQVYSAAYEQDYQDLLISNYCGKTISVKLVEIPSCIKDGVCQTYFGVANLKDLVIERPQIGTKMKMKMAIEKPACQLYTSTEEMSQVDEPVLEGPADDENHFEPEDESAGGIRAMFNDHQDLDDNDPNTWIIYVEHSVLHPPIISPSLHIVAASQDGKVLERSDLWCYPTFQLCRGS
jgi:hypothetical protein